LAGLPDCLFSYQKFQFGYILEGFGIENIGIFYDHLEYFKAKGYMYFQVYFSRFGTCGPRKIWQPWFTGIKSASALSKINDNNLSLNGP
jgi:hypothetical protein